MKISRKDRILLNKVNLFILLGCFLSAYFPPVKSVLVSFYGGVNGVFPFNTIEAHAKIAGNSGAVISQLMYIWLIFIPYVTWGAMQSKKECHIKNINDPEKRRVILIAIFLGLATPLFGLLYASAEPSFCRGCEYGNQITGGIIRVGFMWLFGFVLGQSMVFIMSRKSRED